MKQHPQPADSVGIARNGYCGRERRTAQPWRYLNVNAWEVLPLSRLVAVLKSLELEKLRSLRRPRLLVPLDPNRRNQRDCRSGERVRRKAFQTAPTDINVDVFIIAAACGTHTQADMTSLTIDFTQQILIFVVQGVAIAGEGIPLADS